VCAARACCLLLTSRETTQVCAIIGGVFTVIGIIDSVVFRSISSLKKKVELGKQG
jgi:hypothetical protein